MWKREYGKGKYEVDVCITGKRQIFFRKLHFRSFYKKMFKS